MRISFFLIVFLLVAAITYSQSNEEIDLFMGKEKADIGTASAFVLAAAGIELQGNSDSAIEYINKNKWFKNEVKESDSLRIDYASYIIMKAFNQKGGIMYKFVSGPRYALKEMKYLKMVDQKTYPAKIISGEDFMILLSEYLSWKEEN